MLGERRRRESVPGAAQDERGNIELRCLPGQVHGLSRVEILSDRLRSAGSELVHPEADRVTRRGRRKQELLCRPEEEDPPKGSGNTREQAVARAVDPWKLRATRNQNETRHSVRTPAGERDGDSAAERLPDAKRRPRPATGA